MEPITLKKKDKISNVSLQHQAKSGKKKIDAHK